MSARSRKVKLQLCRDQTGTPEPAERIVESAATSEDPEKPPIMMWAPCPVCAGASACALSGKSGSPIREAISPKRHRHGTQPAASQRSSSRANTRPEPGQCIARPGCFYVKREEKSSLQRSHAGIFPQKSHKPMPTRLCPPLFFLVDTGNLPMQCP